MADNSTGGTRAMDDSAAPDAQYQTSTRRTTVAKGEWQDLSPPERMRMYHYANGEQLEFRDVTRVKVSESGNHYLESAGVKGIVAPGWRAITLDVDAWTF